MAGHRQTSRARLRLLALVLAGTMVFAAGGVASSWLIQMQLVEQTRRQMDMTSQGIHAMVRGLVVSSIKNYLKGVSEANLAYVRHVHQRFRAGEIGEAEAKGLAEAFLLAQRVGETGYVTAADISSGRVVMAVHPHIKGQDITESTVGRLMTERRSGYVEFEWRNPGEAEARLKAGWMSYFAPWGWIISALPFRDEYPQLVDLAGIEAELAALKGDVGGYPFIMDMTGLLLAHPDWKGLNALNARDAVTGREYVRDIIDAIHQASDLERRDGLSGQVAYAVKDPAGSDQVFERLMVYRYIPEVQWIVGVATDQSAVARPSTTIRGLLGWVLGIGLALALAALLWAIRPLAPPRPAK